MVSSPAVDFYYLVITSNSEVNDRLSYVSVGNSGKGGGVTLIVHGEVVLSHKIIDFVTSFIVSVGSPCSMPSIEISADDVRSSRSIL